MHALAARLFALPRSLTGDGVRATLAALGELVPLTVVEVPTGTPVLDWTVPKEWNLRRAVLRGPGGEIVADLGAAKKAMHGDTVAFALDLAAGDGMATAWGPPLIHI